MALLSKLSPVDAIPSYSPEQFRALVSPLDGDECFLRAEPIYPTVWHLRYRADSTSAYKWEFLGGAPLYAQISGAELAADNGLEFLSTTSWGNVQTPGPAVVVPASGEYDVEFGCLAHTWTGGANGGGKVGVAVEYGTPSESHKVQFDLKVANAQVMLGRRIATLTVNEGQTIALRYAALINSVQARFTNRWIRVTPRRVAD